MDVDPEAAAGTLRPENVELTTVEQVGVVGEAREVGPRLPRREGRLSVAGELTDDVGC